MIHELTSDLIRDVSDFAEIEVPTPRPQEGDHSLVLLAKAAALLERIWQKQNTSGVIFDRAGNALQVRHQNVVVTAAATDTELVPALADHVIRVLDITFLAGSTATSITLGSKVAAAATTTLSGPWTNAANGGVDIGPGHIHGLFADTATSGALVATTGAGSSTTLRINYAYVPDDGYDWNDGDPIQWIDGEQIQ